MKLEIEPGVERRFSEAKKLVQLTARERDTFNLLWRLRRKEAELGQVPAYRVFPNSTLLAIVKVSPRSIHDLREVRGMGESRMQRYGRKILRVIAKGTD